MLAVCVLPLWLSIMDATILNIAYDDIVASLGATLDEVSWASTAYMLASVTMLPLTGWLVARFGRKKVFLTIVALFAIGSILCAFATTATQLAVYRVIQGIGGGLLGSVSQAMLLDAYPNENRSEAINLLSLLAMVAYVAGPIIGGFVLERLSWPMLFFLNVPLAAFTIWLSRDLDLDQREKSDAGRFSYITLALLFGALLAAQFVLQSGQRLGWLDSPAIVGAMVAAIVLGGALVWQQLRVRQPMIDLRLFRNPEFLIGSALGIIAFSSNYATGFVFPLFLQEILGFSPLQVATIMIPAIGALFLGNRIQDYLTKRVSLYWILSPSLLMFAVALWYSGVYADSNDSTSIICLRMLNNFASGLLVIPIGVLAFKTIPKNAVDAASGLFALIRQESGMVGIALTGVLLEASQNFYFRRLLTNIPRWPLLHQRGASHAAIIAAVDRRAEVMAYQHTFAMMAVVMVVFAAVIASYGIAKYLCRLNPREIVQA